MTEGGGGESLSFGLLLLHLPLAGAAQLARRVFPSCRLSLRVLHVNQLPRSDGAALCRGGSALSAASLRDALGCVSPGCPTRSRSVRCVICVRVCRRRRRIQTQTIKHKKTDWTPLPSLCRGRNSPPPPGLPPFFLNSSVSTATRWGGGRGRLPPGRLPR